VQIAAHDVGRLSRLVAGCAGVAVAMFGILTVYIPPDRKPPGALISNPAAALVPAGFALVLLVLPIRHWAVRAASYTLAALVTLIGVAALASHTAAAPALALSGLALSAVDLRIRRSPTAPAGYRVADPLVAGATIIALVALVPRMFEASFPGGATPELLMSPYVAGALLTLALGIVLARPEAGPLRTDAVIAGPGTKIRRVLPALIGLPVIAALVSALAARSGLKRPIAAISTGAVLAAFAVLVLVGYLVRSLEGADRRQRELLAKLDERRKFADTLLQSMNEAVMVLDANYRVIDVNRRWRELTGLTASAAFGVRPDPLPEPGTSDFSIRRADGTDVPVLATMATVAHNDGSPRAYVATYVDIADRRAAEDALTDHAADLQRGNAQLLEANTRLEAALAFKNDLTSMLTHDLNQPISSIACLSELLTADWSDLRDDVRQDMAARIDKNIRRLIKMMYDLQLLFRLDTGSVTARRTPVPLLEVVESVAATADDDVEITIDEQLTALADRGHLAAVVHNLLTNALAYGAAPVTIRAVRDGDTVVLTVQDNGPGIPEDLVPKMFDRFMRGSGLGLFIVRHLVEANGGTVRYERATPTGAGLIVTLESAAIPT
jgi:signal transduction histidine kinase